MADQSEPPRSPAVSEEPFLRRWSRRKREAGTGGPEELPAVAGEEEAEVPPLTDEEMPPLESLTPESDYSGFLSPGVSESLRRVALRKLFHAPEFNRCDGLDDYDDDFRAFAGLGGLVTQEMRKRLGEMAEEAGNEMAASAPADDPQPGQPNPEEQLDEDDEEETG